MEVILIAAMARNRVIGRDNDIPWQVPGEQARFKETTMGAPLLMGRRTWESLGRPLPGRRNIVVSRDPAYRAEGAETVQSLEQGLDLVSGEERAFVIGGGQLYALALERADTLILTILHREVEGDVFFPKFACPPFQLVASEEVDGPEPYSIRTYRRMDRNKTSSAD